MSKNKDVVRRETKALLADEFPEAVELGAFLAARGLTIGTAESCTGGLLSATLTAVPGSSAYMVGAIVAYSNAMKTKLLNVDAALIAEHGAVSEQVAAAMALGCIAALGVDVAIGITGVAGPAADGSDKPVGRIYVAVAVGESVSVEHHEGDRGREPNRAHGVRSALRLCADALTW